jgi:hypothetical protein
MTTATRQRQAAPAYAPPTPAAAFTPALDVNAGQWTVMRAGALWCRPTRDFPWDDSATRASALCAALNMLYGVGEA